MESSRVTHSDDTYITNVFPPMIAVPSHGASVLDVKVISVQSEEPSLVATRSSTPDFSALTLAQLEARVRRMEASIDRLVKLYENML
jgi:hypothetical protein